MTPAYRNRGVRVKGAVRAHVLGQKKDDFYCYVDWLPTLAQQERHTAMHNF
jgi:hypothetical protein